MFLVYTGREWIYLLSGLTVYTGHRWPVNRVVGQCTPVMTDQLAGYL